MYRWILALILCGSLEGKMTTAPYGSWKSPITSEMIVSHAISLSDVRETDGHLYWTEGRPSEKGRYTIVRLSPSKGAEDLVPQPYNSRTRVHEYGGKSYLVVGQTLYFSNFIDQQLYRRDPSGFISPLTHLENSRFADGCYDPHSKLLFYVLEVHGKTVENCLAAIDPKTGSVHKIAEGFDFYARPRVSPDGKFLSYQCWNHPNMPWDGCELHLAELNSDGTLQNTRTIAGGLKESISLSSWGPDNRLYFVSDRSGWWNLYRENEGQTEPLYPMKAEFSSPDWRFGQSMYDFWGRDKIVCCFSEKGYDHLAILSLKSGAFHLLKVPFTSIQSVNVSGNNLYFLGATPNQSLALIQYDLESNDWTILKKTRETNLDSNFISVPEAIEFPTENNLVSYAFYYPPKNPHFKGPSGDTPPLRLLSHGGPTSQAHPQFSLEIQYWTSRGFAIVDVNYGGSSGYGRAYRDRLKGTWGVVDVDDCVNAARYCVSRKLADPKRLAIAGGSAGGFTTLAALTFRNLFGAGASYFGVSDLGALAHDTHKFESRYLDQLVGPYPAEEALYRERSPLYHVDQIRCPIILLQGDEDAIVPPPQSEKMYESLRKRGIPTAYLLFKGEQHGFRQAANIKRALEAEIYFYSKIFGFTLADPVLPIEIANFKER